MTEVGLIKLIVGSLFVLFFAVRMVNFGRAVKTGGRVEYREKNLIAIEIVRKVVGVAWLAAIGAFFFRESWVGWASIPLPLWLRWIGVGGMAVSVPMVWWTEVSLGQNFNTTLHVREGHTLVTHGPYRWVRHPMYTALFALMIGFFLATANWLVGVPGLAVLIAIVVNRIDQEEAVMVEQFGDEYRAYMTRTGRFLPRVFG